MAAAASSTFAQAVKIYFDNEFIFKCQICLKLRSKDDKITDMACGHQACRFCVREFLQTFRILRCPFRQLCNASMSIDVARRVLNEHELASFNLIDRPHAVRFCFEKPHASKELLPPTIPEKKRRFTCVICAESLPFDDIFVSKLCQHDLCRECMRSYFNSLASDCRLLTCPIPNCEAELSPFDAEMVLSPEEYERLSKSLFKIGTASCFQCPQNECPGLAELVPPQKIFDCPVCHHKFCTACRKSHGSSYSCEEWEIAASSVGQHPLGVEEEKQKLGDSSIQICPGCHQGVQKAHGCNHMVCRCKTHFCYICGKRFISQGWEDHGECQMITYQSDDDGSSEDDDSYDTYDDDDD